MKEKLKELVDETETKLARTHCMRYAPYPRYLESQYDIIAKFYAAVKELIE